MLMHIIIYNAKRSSIAKSYKTISIHKNRATSALEPPPCAAVLLPSAALFRLNIRFGAEIMLYSVFLTCIIVHFIWLEHPVLR